MKAAVAERYGPPEVVRIREIATPTPKDGEILIRIHASTVSSGDWRIRSLSVPAGFGLPIRVAFGLRKPRQPILGSELSGVVAAVGRGVSRFQVGERVFAFSDTRLGCHAEYRCLPEDGMVVATPPALTDETAAALCFGGTTALDVLRRGQLRAGERVLVNGASGAVGTAVVQLARHLGAEVTGVCSAANLDLVRSLGAVHVIDHTREDFSRNGEIYDVIIDTAGTAPYPRCRGSLKPDGRLLLVLAGLPDMLLGAWVSLTSGRRVIAGPAAATLDDLHRLAALAAAGGFRPVIDRVYPLDQIVAAHRYVDTGRKKGNVIISMRD